MVRVAGHTADDRGKLLLALRDDGFNEIGAAVFVESTVIAIMVFPNPAARGINEFLGNVHNRTGREVRQPVRPAAQDADAKRSEEHTSELQSLMRISYAVFCLKKKKTNKTHTHDAV